MSLEQQIARIDETTQFLMQQHEALLQLINKQQGPKDEDKWLSYEECAELLKVGISTVRKCVADGLFNAYKIRGFTRFKKSEVMAAVEKGEIKNKRK